MKIRILRNSIGPKCWYDKHVGKVFPTIGHYIHLGMNTGDYEVTDPDAPKATAIVAAEDCEVLAEAITAEGKCPHCGEPVSAVAL